MLRRILTAPIPFLQWVYAPSGRTRPGHGEIESHMAASTVGQDTSRLAEMEEKRIRHRDEGVPGPEQ